MNGGLKWTAEAPSNIALIKYMGKTEVSGNRPTNTSLSYTLPHLKSIVELEYDESLTQDEWAPLTSYEGRSFPGVELSEKGMRRFLAHLQAMKSHYGFKGFFRVFSANDFPSDCGLASSASSFAALTKAALVALADLTNKSAPTVEEAAKWSQKGSGSSCRSFFSPWSIWTPETVSDVPELSGLGGLLHQVAVVNESVKAVSSSDAHKRVVSSLLFSGRPERADRRVRELISALREDRWREAFEITWAEFWDMHALFETSQPSFGYMTPESLEVLRYVRSEMWGRTSHGPLVTMDAGPNVHLLYRDTPESRLQALEFDRAFRKRFQVISNLKVKES